jgi:hypothetical protein
LAFAWGQKAESRSYDKQVKNEVKEISPSQMTELQVQAAMPCRPWSVWRTVNEACSHVRQMKRFRSRKRTFKRALALLGGFLVAFEDFAVARTMMKCATETRGID